MPYKIVIADYYYPNIDAEIEEFAQLGTDYELIDCTKIVPGGIKDPKELIQYAHDCDALIHQFATLDKAFIDQLEHCKVIVRYAIGMDTVDIEAARAKGIQVANCPDYCIEEVANTAAAHILNAMRKFTVSRDAIWNNDFDLAKIRPIHRLGESTLCLLGFGNIARNLYTKMLPFFKKIVVSDPYFAEHASYPDTIFVTLAEGLSMADVISVHVPLSPNTKHFLSTEEFDMMKDGAVLVNTARGGIIDEVAMLHALNSGKLEFCGLDVLSTEEFCDSPFLHHPKVALTPHIGWCSEEAIEELQRKTARNVIDTFLVGHPIYPVS